MHIEISAADPGETEISELIAQHLAKSAASSPPESCHALDMDALRNPAIRFFAARDGTALAGIGALHLHADGLAELKSMRTADGYRRQGIASRMLAHLIAEAGRNGAKTVALETGTMAEFAAARALYRRHGFTECPPFGDYVEDPNSVFMRRDL